MRTLIGRRTRVVAATLAALGALAIPGTADAIPSGDPYDDPVEPSFPAPDLVMSGRAETSLHLNHEGRYIREVKVTLTVKNYGDKAAGPFKVNVRVNHLIWWGPGGWTGLRVDYLSGLAAGASRDLAPVYVRDEPCVKVLGSADPDDRVQERHETNNARYVVVEAYRGACQ